MIQESPARICPRLKLRSPVAASSAQGDVDLVELGLQSCMIEHSSSLWAGRRVSLSIRTKAGVLTLDDVRVVRSRITPAPNRAVRYVSELGLEQRHGKNPLLRALLAELARPEIEEALSQRLVRRAV